MSTEVENDDLAVEKTFDQKDHFQRLFVEVANHFAKDAVVFDHVNRLNDVDEDREHDGHDKVDLVFVKERVVVRDDALVTETTITKTSTFQV